MTLERWQTLVQSVRQKFTILAEGKEELESGPGYLEYVECQTPMGKVCLELTVTPRVAEKKTYYSKRAGSSTTVEYKYDPEAHVLTLKIWLWDERADDWRELKPEAAAGLTG